jgi:hypothetical protein
MAVPAGCNLPAPVRVGRVPGLLSACPMRSRCRRRRNRGHLAEHCARGVFWQSRRKLRPGHDAGPGDLPDFARARVISGHHIGRSLEQSFPSREIRRVVLLRDPLELQISFYNWQMMDNLAKGLGTYSFDWHVRALPRDFIAHFLLSRWLEIPWPRLMVMADAQKYEILNRALADSGSSGSRRLRPGDRGARPVPGSPAGRAAAQYFGRTARADRLAAADRRAVAARYPQRVPSPQSARSGFMGGLARGRFRGRRGTAARSPTRW